ncbi:MAG: nucleotidyltransferase family protein, partial [Bauldia sp.]
MANRPAEAAESLDPEGLGLLGGCLAFSSNPVADLRRRLFAPGGFESVFRTAGNCRLLPVLAGELKRRALAPPIPQQTQADGTLTSAAAIEQALADHATQRQRFSELLNEIIALLNQQGIDPILLKGARSLWIGRPEWRGLRDLDILVAPQEADRAERTLLESGFGQLPDAHERPRHHHRTPLFRADSPGWVEIHVRGGNHYAERLLPTAELVWAATTETREGRRARLLSPVHHVLHAMIHHHAGHSAFAHGTMDIKGLYEFASELGDLDDAARRDVRHRADAHPRLAAMLDLWIAAAADLFGFVVSEPFAIDADATARWRDIRRRLTGAPAGGKLQGYATEIAFASSTARLRRQPGGGHGPGRLG